jgi:hypothetical protein
MHRLGLLAFVAVAACIAAACNDGSSSTSSGAGAASSSSSSSTGKNEVTLSGKTGIAELAGDKIELKDGTVFVNGISFGPVPAGAEVRYAINAEGRSLFVGGERRNALK